MTGRFTAIAMAAMLMGVASAARAEGDMTADEFCRRAGRNAAIFELLPDGFSVSPGRAPGAFNCVWVFKRGDDEIYTITLVSELVASEMAARQAILMARLPENRHGKTLEALPKMGDDGLSRATVENGVTTLFELEAVKGRRHFLLTIRPLPGKGVNYRVSAASISFLGIGISGL